MQSCPPSEMDGQFMTSFPSTTTATGKTGLRPRVQGAHVTHSATMGITGVTTPRRREASHQQQHQSQPPPPFSRHPSISSSGGGGDTTQGRTARSRGNRSRGNRSSATWTSSSDGGGGGGCDLANLSDTDDVQDRSGFVAEYNRLAGKHGIRLFAPDDYIPSFPDYSPHHRQSQHKRVGWFSRTFLRQPSAASSHASGGSNMAAFRSSDTRRASHKRSVSDLAIHIIQPILKRDSLKGEDLQSLVRLCGKSILYLPSEYAPGSLVLPTCFRATAQYLVQHAADTRGVFRIPGSVRVVSALYDYYCAEGNVDAITSTIRCPNLPLHIKATTHDVASTFKRLLSGLPGGILGSLPLLDALVAIHSQLKGDPEVTRTKQTKLRARLIALAIGSVKSQFRRELICAVFGLLCLIGRAAETAPREDEHGRPLPTADLMGYSALGIVFGPLLVSDLLNSYTMRLAHPSVGLVLFPVTPPNTRRERRKSRVPSGEEANQQGSLTVDKIHVANSITEMLITHWRDVVKHMRSLDILRACATSGAPTGTFPDDYSPAALRPSASESFVIRKPAEWSAHRSPRTSLSVPKFPPDMSESPIPPSPTPEARRGSSGRSRSGIGGLEENNSRSSSLVVQRQRPKLRVRSCSGSRVAPKASLSLLSPTAEEPASLHDFETSPGGMTYLPDIHQTGYHIPPMMCYTAPIEVPHQRTPSPQDQLVGGSYRDDDEPSRVDNGMVDPGDRRSEEGPLVSNGSIKPADDTAAHPIRRRAYSQISAKGAGKNVFRSSLPEPSTPPYTRSSFRGGQARSSLPKPSTIPFGKGGTVSEDQAVVSMSESKGKAPNTGSSFRLRSLSDAERIWTDEGDDASKHVDISASESQRKEKRPTRRLLKGSRSSHSSHGSTARSGPIMHGQGEESDVRASDVEGSVRQQKNSIFPHWKQRHHRSEQESEAGESADPNPSNIQPPVPPKSKMRLSFHLRKSASESHTGSQEQRRPPRSVAGSRSEDQYQHEKELNKKIPHSSLAPRRGGGRSSQRGNQSSTSQVPSVEAANTGAPTSPTISGVNTTTPSRIPIPYRQANSGAGRLRSDTKGKEREPVKVPPNTSSPTLVKRRDEKRRDETPRGDNIAAEDNKPSVTPTTPLPKLNKSNKDLTRVQTPAIPTRTSSVNRYSKSSVGRTPFPATTQPVPTTPAMESPSRRPRGPTGSSVKAMAAMFENTSTSSVSAPKPPVPVFGIPTPIFQGKEKKKMGSNSSLVGEYTVNSVTPSRTTKQKQAGGSKKKPFSFSPVKKSLRESIDSRGSTEGHSEQSWVTVVPCSIGGSSDVDSSGHGVEHVEDERGNVTHPACEDPEVFWTTGGERIKNTGDEDGSQQTHEETEDQDGSVRIRRPLASEKSNDSQGMLQSEGSEKGEPSRGRRRVRSTISRGSHPQRRVVASVMTPPRLGKIVTGSLSGLRSVAKTQMKGSPAEPEVDLSTAVASLNPGSQSRPHGGNGKEPQYQASVGSDLDRLSSETQMHDHQKGGEGSQERVSFLPPVRFVTFSDLDLESPFDLSASQGKTDQASSHTPMLDDVPTVSAGPQVSSSAMMEVPYLSFMESLLSTTGKTSTPLHTKTDTVPTIQGAPSGPSSIPVPRKTTGASNSDVSSPPITRSLRASSSNAALHLQIGKLQRLVYSKTEEVNHLRQQLEMKQDTIDTLRERCTETENESKTWRQRAEVAETKVATFQRIMANMRNRRTGMVVGEVKDDDHPQGQDQGVNEAKGKDQMGEEEMKLRQPSNDMHTEDEGAVADRIRAAIHGGESGHERGVGHGLDGEDGFWADDVYEDGLEVEGLLPRVCIDEDGGRMLVPFPSADSKEGLSHGQLVERDAVGVGSRIGSPGPSSKGPRYHIQPTGPRVIGAGSKIENPGPNSTGPQDHYQRIERDIIDAESGAESEVGRSEYNPPDSGLSNQSHGHQKKSSSSNYFDYYLGDKQDNTGQDQELEHVEKGLRTCSHDVDEDEHEDEGNLISNNSDMDDDDDELGEGDGAVDVDIDDDNRSYTTASTNRTTRTTGSAASEGGIGGERSSLSSAMHMWIRAVEQGERSGDWESEWGDNEGS